MNIRKQIQDAIENYDWKNAIECALGTLNLKNAIYCALDDTIADTEFKKIVYQKAIEIIQEEINELDIEQIIEENIEDIPF